MTNHLPPQWRERLLAVVGAHATPENLRLLLAWALAEGGAAVWNPLNTTMPLPGSTLYNTLPGGGGVQNYIRATWGVCATALTLTNGHYPGILGDLQGGTKTAEQIVTDRFDQFKTWGTDPLLIRKILAE